MAVREIAALLLAGVFLVAGGAKLFDPAGTRRSVRELGLPSRLGWPAAIVLPVLELVLAAGLVVASTSRAAAAAAAILLTLFAAVIGINVARGRNVDCGCFGPLHSSKAGTPAATRNGALALLALALAGSAAEPVAPIELGAALVLAALAAQAAAWIVLLRRYGRALRRIDALETSPERETGLESQGEHGLDVGAEAPGFEFPGVDGPTLALADVLDGSRPVVLVVTDERCGACAALYPDVARWQRELHGDVAVVVLGDGSPEKLRAIAQEHEIDALLHADRATLDAYGIYGTPSAVLIDPDGRIASPVRYGGLDIEALVLDAAEWNAMEVMHHG